LWGSPRCFTLESIIDSLIIRGVPTTYILSHITGPTFVHFFGDEFELFHIFVTGSSRSSQSSDSSRNFS
jgi:hypothetical protein